MRRIIIPLPSSLDLFIDTNRTVSHNSLEVDRYSTHATITTHSAEDHDVHTHTPGVLFLFSHGAICMPIRAPFAKCVCTSNGHSCTGQNSPSFPAVEGLTPKGEPNRTIEITCFGISWFLFPITFSFKILRFFLGERSWQLRQWPTSQSCFLHSHRGLITPINLIVSRTSEEAGGW